MGLCPHLSWVVSLAVVVMLLSMAVTMTTTVMTSLMIVTMVTVPVESGFEGDIFKGLINLEHGSDIQRRK